MEAVTVVARFRGAESGDDDFGDWALTDTTIKHNEKHHEFNFDAVLNPSRTQAELYEAAGRKILNFFCDGYNATVFAYGQSGSGKTFSMLGPETVTETLVNKDEVITPEVEALFGMLPRSTFHIFETIKEGEAKGSKFDVRVSYIEVYNEMINDILACPPNLNLKLREFPNSGMSVIGMLENVTNSPEAVFEAISAGTANRVVCSTGQNARSSRSHTVFIISLSQTTIDGTVKKSKINLVDLAGSEKLSKTGAQGQALKEAQKINLSLTTLGRCIKALTSGGAEHVPYRESKLTLILKESLSGSAMTVLIVTGSMRKIHQEETIGTMQFAERAKMVKTAAKSNTKRPYEELERLVNKLTEEVAALKKAIGSGGTIPESLEEVGTVEVVNSVELDELKIKYETLEENSTRQIEELKVALERAETKMGNAEYVGIQEEMDSFKQRIEESSEQIEGLQQKKAEQKAKFAKEMAGLEDELNEEREKFENKNSKSIKASKNLDHKRKELAQKEAELFAIRQEIQEFTKTENHYQKQITNLQKRIESNKEIPKGKLDESERCKQALDEVSRAIEESSCLLAEIEESRKEHLEKISELERKESLNSDALNVLRLSCETLKQKISKKRIQIDKQENDAKVAHFALAQSKEQLLKEKTRLEQEVIRITSEIDNCKKNNEEATSEEVKEAYANSVLQVHLEQLEKIKEEYKVCSEHLEDISAQKKHTEDLIAEYSKENETIIEKIKEIEVRFRKISKELAEEQELKNKVFLDLKNIEASQQKAIDDAENAVKQEMGNSYKAILQQDELIQSELNKKEEELKKFRHATDAEAEKLKSELIVVKTENFELESEIRRMENEKVQRKERNEEDIRVIENLLLNKTEKIFKLLELIKSQESTISEKALITSKLEANIKNKVSERETERRMSSIRKTLIPKRGTIFNKIAAKPQEKGPEFILRKTDNKFLTDAIQEAQEIAKSEHSDILTVCYDMQAIKALYGDMDLTVPQKSSKVIIEEAEE